MKHLLSLLAMLLAIGACGTQPGSEELTRLNESLSEIDRMYESLFGDWSALPSYERPGSQETFKSAIEQFHEIDQQVSDYCAAEGVTALECAGQQARVDRIHDDFSIESRSSGCC